LELTHPVTGNLLQLESPLPSDMEALLPLHAHRLELTHPVTGNLLQLESPLPSDMEALLPESI
jgi:23S rRNA-/tRNA-specific pseudouridylate synthase